MVYFIFVYAVSLCWSKNLNGNRFSHEARGKLSIKNAQSFSFLSPRTSFCRYEWNRGGKRFELFNFRLFIFSFCHVYIFDFSNAWCLWHQTNVCYNSLFQKNIFFVYWLCFFGEPSTYQAGFYLADNVGTFKISLRIPKSHWKCNERINWYTRVFPPILCNK